MNLFRRIGWYLGGFSVGLVILAIFLKKKNVEFCYGIDCRILKNIRSKNIKYSSSFSKKDILLDTIAIRKILLDADVNISKSNTKLDSCKIYYIEGTHLEKDIYITIENCSETANILSIE